MRNRMAWLVCVLVFAAGGMATWSFTRGQPSAGPAGLPALPESKPATPAAPLPAPGQGPSPAPPVAAPGSEPAASPGVPAVAGKPGDAPAAGSPLQQQVEFSARRGAEWLFRMNTVKGRFVPGLLPSVNRVPDGDNYLRQVGAALALARAARYTGDAACAARATQAVVSLLDDTTAEPDPSDAKATLRHTALPSTVVNRLGAAGLLVAAVHELPSPQADLLKKSDELCNYLRRQQRDDGSLRYTDGDDDKADPDGLATYPGEALYGLARSQQHRPAPWKADVARKALAYYGPYWRAHKGRAFVPWQTAARAEAFLLTKEKAFADFVFEMSDWLIALQYDALDPAHPEWLGGFADGRANPAAPAAPDVSTGGDAEALAEACRVARAAADLSRHQRYTGALESALQFLTTLQYTDANTQHFAPLYRQRALVGGFHASHTDGDLRLDYTQHALCAMIQYLTCVAR